MTTRPTPYALDDIQHGMPLPITYVCAYAHQGHASDMISRLQKQSPNGIAGRRRNQFNFLSRVANRKKFSWQRGIPDIFAAPFTQPH